MELVKRIGILGIVAGLLGGGLWFFMRQDGLTISDIPRQLKSLIPGKESAPPGARPRQVYADPSDEDKQTSPWQKPRPKDSGDRDGWPPQPPIPRQRPREDTRPATSKDHECLFYGDRACR